MPRPDALQTALHTLQERLLKPEEYQQFGEEVIRAAQRPFIRNKYEIATNFGSSTLAWERDDTQFSLQSLYKYHLLFVTRVTESNIELVDAFAFGDETVVYGGVSWLAHFARRYNTGQSHIASKVRLLAKDEGKFRRDDLGFRKRQPLKREKIAFRRALLTIGELH